MDTTPCKPVADGDYVHRSSTGVAASAHGWWKEGTCSVPYGTVDITLWEFWVSDSSWHSMASNSGTVRPGGGSSAWVGARKDCRATSNRTWHSVIHVIVGGEQYGSDSKTTQNVSIPCVA